MASVYDKIFTQIVQKSRVYSIKSRLFFKNPSLFHEYRTVSQEKVDWVGTMQNFSPNNFEYWLSSLCNMYLAFLVPSSLSVVYELMYT